MFYSFNDLYSFSTVFKMFGKKGFTKLFTNHKVNLILLTQFYNEQNLKLATLHVKN